MDAIPDEDHYTWALSRIWELWEAEVGSPEHEELEMLIDLVEAYEDKWWPIGKERDSVEED